ncbi:hypothetical protein Aduo_005956 [Ancylostoma duodenale]
MGQRSVYDPHDPWAFRNTWTGEIRNSYDDLWIWVTLIVSLTMLALCILVPVLVHIYCKDACFCLDSCRCFERFLSVCHTMSWEKRERSRRRGRSRRNCSNEIEDRLPATQKEQHRHHEQCPRVVDFRQSRRSYPSSFYPRSVTLPSRSAHNPRERCHSENQRIERFEEYVDVPRLKLNKK